ncbi:glutathione S-transferase family protein [Marinobacter sp. CHS3-4]|uniref:glutathione S-transferase family protein n=1 Tax=Marinobacter sp. CHS3-4 TaxID=3045174 RepID=UPI0024B4BA2E|nr:glutathione S-transferase family protein [Marinobacter sp. CHS3-4]MDI9245369.1 glutathione S-transferase family protein [Marinobacter sp. CHS3-4]
MKNGVMGVKVYGDLQSGNCYKIKLMCALLGIQHDWVHMDILAGDTRNEAFGEKNPNQKIPVIELADGRLLWESNAIINFLAQGSSLLPEAPFDLAKVQQWQFFEQYSHEPYIAVARFINKYLGLPEDRKAEFETKQAGGRKALSVMENQLAQTQYLVGDCLTTADISLYAYTHVANEGGFSLDAYPCVTAWLERIRSQPQFVPLG